VVPVPVAKVSSQVLTWLLLMWVVLGRMVVTWQVVVDDLFPVGRDNKMLCSCSKDPRELWVRIISTLWVAHDDDDGIMCMHRCTDVYNG
jgi:hypothetical protein